MMIRPANSDAVKNIAQLYVQNHVETYKGLLPDAYFESLTVEHAIDKWLSYLNSSEKMIWVSFENGLFLGFSAGMPDEELANTWYLDSLHVTKDARGKGVGSALIRQNMTHAASQGFGKMSICIVRGNDNARKLYEKHGAEHYCYFDDNFAGSISHSEKLIWSDLPGIP